MVLGFKETFGVSRKDAVDNVTVTSNQNNKKGLAGFVDKATDTIGKVSPIDLDKTAGNIIDEGTDTIGKVSPIDLDKTAGDIVENVTGNKDLGGTVGNAGSIIDKGTENAGKIIDDTGEKIDNEVDQKVKDLINPLPNIGNFEFPELPEPDIPTGKQDKKKSNNKNMMSQGLMKMFKPGTLIVAAIVLVGGFFLLGDN